MGCPKERQLGEYIGLERENGVELQGGVVQKGRKRTIEKIRLKSLAKVFKSRKKVRIGEKGWGKG